MIVGIMEGIPCRRIKAQHLNRKAMQLQVWLAQYGARKVDCDR
jgi:hypothetical protein